MAREGRDLSSSGGAVLVLVTLLIFVIIIFIALVVDVLVASSASRQLGELTEEIAIGAMEGFNSAERDSKPAWWKGGGWSSWNPHWTMEEKARARLKTAVYRANAIASKSTVINAETTPIYDEGEEQYITPPVVRCLQVAIGGQTVELDDNCVGQESAGRITPGNYYEQMITIDGVVVSPPASSPCATTMAGASNKPCFQEVASIANGFKDANGNDVNVTAFRVETQLLSPVRTFFAKVFGFDSIPIKAAAMVTYRPRHAAILIDLSNSIVGETHLSDNPLYDETTNVLSPNQYLEESAVSALNAPDHDTVVTGMRSYFAFKEKNIDDQNIPWEIPTRKKTDGTPWTVDSPSISSSPKNCDDVTKFADILKGDHPRTYDWDEVDSCIWDALDESTALREITVPQLNRLKLSRQRHFKENYKVSSGALDLSLTPSDVSGIAGTSVISRLYVDQEDEASPLFPVLNGVHTAVAKIKERKIPGDLIALYGFDERVPHDSSETRAQALTNDFDVLLRMTDVTTEDPNDFIHKFLFPDPEQRTDLRKALEYARKQLLKADGSKEASNMIILATDGLANCYRPATGTPCPAEQLPIGNVSGLCCSATKESAWDAASAELYDNNFLSDFLNEAVPIHVIMFGDKGGPHTLNVLSKVGGAERTDCLDIDRDIAGRCCATDEEKRTLNEYYVDHRCEPGHEDDNCAPYSKAFIKRSTKVFFGASGLMYNLARRTRGYFFPVRPVGPMTTVTVSGLTYSVACQGPSMVVGGVCNAYRTCDQDGSTIAYPAPGRQLFDPQGRDATRQIEDAMDKILGSPPIALKVLIP